MMDANGSKALVHYLCNMEYTGRRYHGSKADFMADLDLYVSRYEEVTDDQRGKD